VEHHLFPRLPRHNLRKARALVKPICEKHGTHYHERTPTLTLALTLALALTLTLTLALSRHPLPRARLLRR